MLSIIIPTLNEERFLPLLLRSLRNQSFQDFEVIVADAKSKDRTRAIAHAFGARVVDGGLPGVGRNKGAKVAKGDLLLFLDADVVLPNFFLEKNVADFRKRNLDVATTFVKPLSSRFDDKVIHFGWNVVYLALQNIRPACCGFHIFIRKDVFARAGGFDESVVFCEDADLIARLHKMRADFGVLSSPVFVSVRRLNKEGRMKFLVKNITGYLHTAFKGPIRKQLFKYEWGHK